MYTRLIIAVLIVAAVVVNTATAQGNSTAAPNATTAVPPVSAGSSNTTGSAGSSNTTVSAGSSNTTGSTGSSNTTGSAGSSNTTASNATTTTQSPTTTPIPVAALPTSISKAGCGTQQLCLSQPASCDPSTSGSCYFISSQQLSGQTYQLGLSGSSPGYIATALSTASSVGNNDTTYICANNNGAVQFFVAYLNGNVLQTTSTGSVSSVSGSASGNKIQCIFNATLPAGATKALNFRVGFLTGNYTNGTLGNATVLFQQSADLSNPASHAITFKQSLAQAVLIVAIALGLTV